MAVPLNNLAPAEIEFMAENELVNIVPNFHMDQLHFISRPTQVPLWLAVTLKKRAKCKIQPPAFLNPDTLRDLLEQEKGQARFCPLPFHYLEVAYMLLECASDDLPKANAIRSQLEDLRELRQVKARKSLEALQSAAYLKMNNISMMELNATRPFLLTALDELHMLRGDTKSLADSAPEPAPAASQGPAVRQRP